MSGEATKPEDVRRLIVERLNLATQRVSPPFTNRTR
jgi:hypothetical protein